MAIFELNPKKKRVGLFKGELWVDTATGMPLKEMGRWRINLKHLSSSERFDDVRVRIMEKLDEDAKDDLSRICVKEIRTSMDNAFSFWFSAAPTPVPQYA